MKRSKWLFGLFILFFGIFQAAAVFAQEAPRGVVNLKVYFPGDFVHVIVDAPPDTTQITATMPDGTLISLVQSRRTTVWRGIWQVPIDFAKGSYSVKLSAVDVAGDIFEGQTDPFEVAELAVVTLVGKPTKEAVVEKAPLKEKLSIEAAAPSAAGEELLNRLMKVISQPAELAAPEIEKGTKQQLIETNLNTGKDQFNRTNYRRASAYFRIVLYLAPDNKEAALFLAQSNDLLKRENQRQQRTFILTVIGVVLAVGLVWILAYYMSKIFASKKTMPPVVTAPLPISEKEQRDAWLKKIGWTGNPFSADIFQQLFIGDNLLEPEGLKGFMRSRIESVGGRNIAPFTDSAFEEIYHLSKGKPKTVFRICEWAVEYAISKNLYQIMAEIIREYAKSKPVTILIADDEEVVRASLEAILKKGGGYDTDFAFDGEETVRKVKENVYGLVLLDIAMPKIDGYEALKQIRNMNPNLPVIFVTGKGIPQKTVESIDKFNLTGYIEKPFTPEKVLDVVARNLKNR